MMDHESKSECKDIAFTFPFTSTFKNPVVSKQYLLLIT